MHRHIFSFVGLLLTISTAAADADQSRPQPPTRPARQHEARSATDNYPALVGYCSQAGIRYRDSGHRDCRLSQIPS